MKILLYKNIFYLLNYQYVMICSPYSIKKILQAVIQKCRSIHSAHKIKAFSEYLVKSHSYKKNRNIKNCIRSKTRDSIKEKCYKFILFLRVQN